MSDSSSIEKVEPKPKTPDQLATEYYQEESSKRNGGNPVIKEVIWLSGLTSPLGRDRKQNIERVVNMLLKIPDTEFGLDKKDVLVDRVVGISSRFNGSDLYTVDASQLDVSKYKKMLRLQPAKAA